MAEIVSDPGVLGGKPRLKDHRISVLDVVELLEAGHTTGQVAYQLDISKAEVQAARQYWEAHPEEIAEQRAEREAAHEELQQESRAPSS